MKFTIAGANRYRPKLNILLVTAYQSFSLAPAYFYEAFRNGQSEFNDISLYIKSYRRFWDEVDYSFIHDILLIKPDMVAFSNFFWNFEDNLKLARLAKSMNNGAFVIFGGPQVGEPDDSRKILEEHDCIDYALCGEADFTFAQLLSALSAEQRPLEIPGLVYRAEDGFIAVAGDCYVKDLSTLPVVYDAGSEYVSANFNRYRAMPLETIRGCRSQCSYCRYCINTLRYKPLKTAELEIAFLCRNRASHVRVCDSHFGGSQARAMELFDIISHYNKSDTEFYIYPDPDHVDQGYIRAARTANCHIISLGIETLDESITKAISRRVSSQKSIQALSLLKSEKIKPQVDLMLGLPGQTLESFINDIITLMANSNSEILFSPLMLFPGTKIRKDADLLKLRTLETNQNFALNASMSEQEYITALKAIDLQNIIKNLSHTESYTYNNCLEKPGYEEFLRKIFAVDFMSSCFEIEKLSEWLGMGAQFLRKKHTDFASAIRRLFAEALRIDFKNEPYIDEIIRYDLLHRAMKLTNREIGNATDGCRSGSDIFIWDEIKSAKLIIKENCWLEQFYFPPKLLADQKSEAEDINEKTYCIFICDYDKSHILSESEYEYLSSFKTARKLDGLDYSNETLKAHTLKWLKAGVLAPAGKS